MMCNNFNSKNLVKVSLETSHLKANAKTEKKNKEHSRTNLYSFYIWNSLSHSPYLYTTIPMKTAIPNFSSIQLTGDQS